jgi:type I restriction enzyme S subunit
MSRGPAGWTTTTFPEIADILDSKRVPLNAGQRAARPGPYPYYGANGLVDHVDGYLFDGDHVLLAEDGGHFDEPERGVAYTVHNRFWVNNHAHILKPIGGINCGFLKAWLNATNWLPFVGGTTRAKLTQAGLGQPEVPLPPLAEQERIVAKLDALTARTAQARAELDRVPALAARYKQTILAAEMYPQVGRMKPLSDVVTEALIGLIRSRADQSTVGGLPYVRMQHYDLDGVWNNDDLTYVAASDRERQRYGLRAGDLLFNTRNSADLVGKVALCPADVDGWVYNNNLLRLRFHQSVLPAFAFRQIQSPPFRAHLEDQKSATTSVAAIYQGALFRTPFWVPNLADQAAIVRRIDLAFTEIERLTAEAAAARRLLDRLDQAILAKAFRGELVPQDPADEPASALLDRIKAERQDTPRARRGRRAAA